MSITCGSCGHVNREGRRFCAECGQPLTAPVCPACGARNETGEKFCGDCGAPLTPTAVSAQPSPATVSVGGEKKHITVLFADVAGSMDLQERLDPEVWAQIMGRFVSILAEGVRKFGGTVDKFTGDGIMALFGAPVAQEDHARRACHAAWHLTKAIGEWSEELRGDHGIDLQVRLGLNSGDVVVGRVGDDVTLDPTALGHTVGLAQRMEAMAEPGNAYLTDHTARLVGGWFDVDDLGVLPVKGATEPLRVFVLGHPMSRRARPRVGAAPLVGRDRELALLEDALTAAIEGRAQVVGVVGEAGVGKSRLCDDFAASVMARAITVRRTAGVSHGRDLPLLPVLALLRDYFGVTDADDAAEARDKISRRVLNLDPAAEDALPLLFDFLEVADPTRPGPRLVAEVRLRRVFDALRRLALRRSEREVLVLVLEDLHWFDPQSEQFLERLIESFPGSRTLVVANFRPEFSARWMRHSYYRQVPLAPLQDSAVEELLGGLLGMDFSLAPLPGFVQERTGGNPFFVEEVVRALVEDGTLIGEPGRYRLTRALHEVKVPATVQAVVAARIDRLLSDQKALLQTAAVIGRRFPAAVLASVGGLGEDDLHDHLEVLCGAEFLQAEPHASDDEYRFWHPLTQEVAYGSLLTERRVHLHLAVANALVELDPARHDERAALIASHFERAGDAGQSARWNFRAGDWAARTDFNEAVRRLRKTIQQLDGVSQTIETRTLGTLARARLLQIVARLGTSIEEAETLVAEGRALAEDLEDVRPLINVVRFYRSVQLNHGAVADALHGALDIVRLTDATGDPGLRAALWSMPAILYTWAGPLDDGLTAADRVIELSGGDPTQGTEHHGYSPLTLSRVSRTRLLGQMGRLGAAVAELDRTLNLARDRGEAEMIAFALGTYSLLAEWSGDDQDASVRAMEAVRVSDDLGSAMIRIVALHGVGLAHLLEGRIAEAAAVLETALAEARQRNVARFEEVSVLAHLARAKLLSGHPEAAAALADEAVELAGRQGTRVLACPALLTRAHIQRASGSLPERVAADLDAALIAAQETGALTYVPFIREELARLHDDDKELSEALRLYRRIGATGHARRLEAELSTRATR
jgi:adenylate cyclase